MSGRLSVANQRGFAEDTAMLDQLTRLSVFKPNAGGQEPFYYSTKHQIVLGGGNKSGKTYCCTVKGALRSVPEKDKYGKNTGWLLDPYLRLRLPRRKVLGWFSTYSQPVQTETLQPVIDDIFGPYITNKYTEKGCHHWIETECARINFKWQKAEVHSYTGANLDWASMDEPHERSIYYEIISRLIAGTKGFAWIGLTAVIDAKDPDYARKMRYIKWMKDELIDPFHYNPKSVPELDVIYVDIEENPHVNAEFAMQMWASLSEEERLIRKTGRFFDFIGQTAFDSDHIKKLEEYLRTTPEVSRPQYGVLEKDLHQTHDNWKITFVETTPSFPEEPDAGWIWKIWEHPVTEQIKVSPDYAIAADPAGGKSGRDYTAVYVMRCDTGRIVAALHGYIDEIELARQLWLAGYYYGSKQGYVDDGPIEVTPAMIAVETVGIGNTTIAYLLNGHPDFDIEKYTFQQLYRMPNKGHLNEGILLPSQDYGWYTSSQSRPHLITAMRQLLSKVCHAIDNDEPVIIPDVGWVKEARTFIMNNQGKFEAAATCHDDRLMASAICAKVVEQVERMRRTWVSKPVVETPDELYYFNDDGELIFNLAAARARGNKRTRQESKLYY